MAEDKRLSALVERVQQAKDDKFKAEARMGELERREGEILGKLKAKGYDPENLQEERDARQRKLTDLMAQAEEILNGKAPAEPAEDKSTVTPTATAPNTPKVPEEIPW